MSPIVIVVDDEEAIADLIGDVLLDLGCQPLLAFNGREALKLMETLSEPPALIVSDLMMPFVDGLELARQVKTHPSWASVSIILMSAVRHQMHDPHVNAFVAKPFNIDLLIQVITTQLEPAEPRASGDQAEQDSRS